MPRYKFVSGCPACGNRELNTWEHSNCGGKEEIDENGNIYCLKCKKNVGFILDMRFKCSGHDHKEIKDATTVFNGLAMLTVSNPNISNYFARNVFRKIMERLDS